MFTYSHANTPLGQSERAYYLSNIIGDELLLNFGAKFQRQFVISHVKLRSLQPSLAFFTTLHQAGNYKDLDKTRVKLLPNFTTVQNSLWYRLVEGCKYRRFYCLTWIRPK